MKKKILISFTCILIIISGIVLYKCIFQKSLLETNYLNIEGGNYSSAQLPDNKYTFDKSSLLSKAKLKFLLFTLWTKVNMRKETSLYMKENNIAYCGELSTYFDKLFETLR